LPPETLLHLQIAATPGGRQADLEKSAQVECEDKQESRHAENEARRLQLKPPAELRTAGAQHQQHRGQRPERKQHAEREDEPVQGDFPAVAARLVHEAEDLDAEHRENAGHEIEDEAADEGEEQRSEQSARRRWRLPRCGLLTARGLS